MFLVVWLHLRMLWLFYDRYLDYNIANVLATVPAPP